MTASSLLNSVEFYIIVAVVAAAIVAVFARPSSRGPVREYLLAGALVEGDGDMEHPRIALRCLDSGAVMLTRTGIPGMTLSGAVSLAVTVNGFDVHIAERLTAGNSNDPQMTAAIFTLDFLAPEWYHIRYTSEQTSRMAAFKLHVRPGIEAERELIR